MSPKTKKVVVVSVVIFTLGVAGVITHYFYKKWKEEQDKKKGEGTPPPVTPPPVVIPTDTPALPVIPPDVGTPPTSGLTRTYSECRKQNPFPSKQHVKNFQKWVLLKYGQILGRTGADGDFGCLTLDAWQKYGYEYTKENKKTPPKPTQSPATR